MDSRSFAIDITQRLKALKEKNDGKLSIDDVSEMLVSIIEATNQVTEDDDIVGELEEIQHAIKSAKGEVADILNDDENHVPEASQHLDEVVKETEAAANAIIDAASAIQALVPNNKEVEAEVTKIFEACNFGDLSRQRIVKVVKHLQDIEAKIDKFFNTLNVKRRTTVKDPNKILLSGPQLSKSAPTQDDIDALFGNL